MKGRRAVAVSGSASVIHQLAIKMTSAATRHASGGIFAGAGKASRTMNSARPPKKPMVFAVMSSPRPAIAGTSDDLKRDQRNLPAVIGLVIVRRAAVAEETILVRIGIETG